MLLVGMIEDDHITLFYKCRSYTINAMVPQASKSWLSSPCSMLSKVGMTVSI